MLLLSALLSLLTPPVSGDITRAFDYGADPFARGQHRGVDLAAAPGAPVRAACGGRVRAAGPVAGRLVVSLDCGPYRVSLLPLEQVTVQPGQAVGRGRRVGTAATGHPGLHLGVRRRSDPFGYVDPEALLARLEPPPSVPAVRHPLPPRGRRPAWRPAAPVATPPAAARPVAAPPAAAPTAAAPTAAAAAPAAPWPAYAGLALLTAGVLGARARRRRARVGHSGAWIRASASSRSG